MLYKWEKFVFSAFALNSLCRPTSREKLFEYMTSRVLCEQKYADFQNSFFVNLKQNTLPWEVFTTIYIGTIPVTGTYKCFVLYWWFTFDLTFITCELFYGTSHFSCEAELQTVLLSLFGTYENCENTSTQCPCLAQSITRNNNFHLFLY